MIQSFNFLIKDIFNSHLINFLNPLTIDEFQSLEIYSMNHLYRSPFHSHGNEKCKSPNLRYILSYTRNYITYKNNQIIENTIDIPVFYCENCEHYHAILPISLISPYCPYSIPFVLCVLYDKHISKLTIDELVEKYQISVSTIYRWEHKFKDLFNYYWMLRNKYEMTFFLSLLYSYEEIISDIFDISGFTLFQTNRKIIYST